MRILAIRGENLASLAAPFELHFDAPPIESSRIFAIVGATGAGKSTILDALCLALFHRTPRLGDMAGGTDVSDGDERIKSYDPRALLHRGATSAYAECDFEGQDGGLYRARWSVKRAKSGRLQPAKPELFHLESGVAIGRTKSQVTAEIGTRLGLDFEQFRRSVLLAQGDFAAFLRASPTERGELLANMTSTMVYGELSRAAHQRARDEHTKLRERRASSEQLAPLKDTERKKLDVRTHELDAKRTALSLLLNERRKRVDVLAHDEKLQLAVDAAEVLVAKERQIARDIGPRRQALQHARSADRFRDVIRALEERRVAHLKTHSQVDQAKSTLRERERQLVDLRQRSATHLDRRRGFDAEASPFEAEQERASDLDAAILGAKESVARCDDECRKARTERDTLKATQNGRRKTMTRLEAEEAVDTAWLKERPYRAEGQGAITLEKVKQHRSFADESLSIHAEAEGTRRALVFLEADSDALGAELARAKTAWTVADTAMRAGEAGSVAPRQARAERLQEALRAREALRRAAESRRGALAELKTRAKAEADARTQQEAINAELTLSTRALTAAQESLAQDVDALDEAERLRHAQRLSDRLVDGDSCPVCGSQEHPSRPHTFDTDEATTLRVAKGTAAALAHKLGETHSDIRERKGAADSQARLGVERLSAAKAVHDDQKGAEEVLSDTYRQALLMTGAKLNGELVTELVQAAETLSPLFKDALDEALDHAKAELADALDASQQTQTNNERRDRAYAARESAERALERGAERVKAAEARLRALDERLRDIVAAQQALSVQLDKLAGPGWGDPLFVDSLESDALTLASLRRSFDERRIRLVELRARASDAHEREHELAKLASGREKAADDARAALHQLQGARSQLLGGLSVAAARANRSLRDVELRENADTHRSLVAEAERLSAAGHASLESLRDELTRREKALNDAKAELEARLLEARVDEAFVRSHLKSPLDRDHEEHALRKIDEAMSIAGARHDQARNEQRIHRNGHAGVFGEPQSVPLQGDLFSAPVRELPSLDIPALRANENDALKSTEEENETLERALIDARAAQQRDDEARQSAATLDNDLRSLEAGTKIWDELAELIGSSDGKKFQLFAQGLTLDILLGHANVQLGRLFPRYQLERTPGSDLSIQVADQDMGGVVRSVDTLSGGETFIVSLALALALAGLSARQMPLRTLFIDEGFGSLDAASLETVLDVLDAVQAEGKQIGIISHVAEIAERFRVRVNVEREGEGRSLVTVHPTQAAVLSEAR
ncbi:MAG: exonuclease SbcC [Polyangiales bacterium]|jgi:exonuclease SbcC